MERIMTIYIAGDSTAANKLPEKRPETGWGEAFARLAAGHKEVRVDNRALNGRSSRSFIDEGQLDAIAATIKAGDFLFVQFGHNDSKDDPARHTEPEAEFPAMLARYAEVARSAGARAVFLTPIVRHRFVESIGYAGSKPTAQRAAGAVFAGFQLADTHGPWLASVRRFAAERNLPLLDLEARTRELVASLGPERSKRLYLHLAPGESENYPEGIADDTHLSEEGAERVASLVIGEIARVAPCFAPMSQLLKVRP